ncbi:MAG: tetratricopeptide repeat protein [Bacteroidota bacterium]|jgi:tetratricopeptide (TPR) repeat protein/DNA-binding CsgD family transcriptional regulator
MKQLLFLFSYLFSLLLCSQTASTQTLHEQSDLFPGVNPDSAMSLLKEKISRAESSGNETAQAEAHQELGEFFYLQGAFSQSIVYLQKALTIYSKQNNIRRQAEIHSALGTTYYFSRQPGLAEREQRQALYFAKQLEDPVAEARVLTRIGHLFEKKGLSDSSLIYHNNALEKIQGTTDSALYAEISENIGSIYEDKGQYEEARKYFFTAMQINTRLGREEDRVINLNNLGDVFRKTGNRELAKQYTTQALAGARVLGSRYQERSALRDLSKIYADENNYYVSHQYLDTAYQQTEAIYAEEGARQMALLESFYETEKKDKEIQLLAQNARIDSLRRWGLLAATLMIIAVAGWQWQKIKSNKKIIAEQNRVFEVEQKLLQIELDNVKLREQQLEAEVNNHNLQEKYLQRELELRSQSLSWYTLQLIEKNKVLEDIQKTLLESLRTDGVQKNKMLRETSKSIEINFRKDDYWLQFEHFFAQVHISFFDELKKHLPDISAGEQRLCALLRMNIEPKEVATVLGITPDSLRIARYRLRKRLKITGKDNLSEFLGKLGETETRHNNLLSIT